MILGIKFEAWLTILAIVVGPLLAFAVQNWRDQSREKRNRRLKIFHSLLLTLKVPMAPVHVDALNSIPLEFYSNKEIMDAWRLYTSHLNGATALKNNPQRWGERKFELLIDLAHKMGVGLGFDHLDKATLSDNIYVPQGYEDREEQFRQMRDSLLKVLGGQHPVPVTMVGSVQVDEPLKLIEELPLKQPPALPALPNPSPKQRS